MRNAIDSTVLNLPKNCPNCDSEQVYDPRQGTPYCDDCGEEISYIWNGKVYVKEAYQPMRPYVEGEDLTGVSVSEEDIPAVGGMIAYNPNNFKDMWYVGKDFFEQNYEEVPSAGNFEEDTLLKLLLNKKLVEAAHTTTRAGIHFEFIVGIGADETASITMTEEAYDALTKGN